MIDGKPKILILISDTNAGGVATVESLLVKRIDRSKYHAIVAAFGPGPVGPEIGRLADEYHNLGVGSFPVLLKQKKGKLTEHPSAWFRLTVWTIRCIWRLCKFLRKNKINVLHSHTIHFNLIGGIAGRICGIPSVWHIHNSQRQLWRLGGPFLVEGYLASWLATKFIAVSQYTANTFHHSWKKKTVVIYNGVDVEAIHANQRKGELKRIAKVSNDEKLIGVIGIIVYRKGMDRFIEVAAKIAQKCDDVKFIIVGSPTTETAELFLKNLVAMSEKLGLADKLCFAGNVNDANLYMSDLDVFFMSSRPDAEALPMVVIEAMAAGVPVVGFANFSMPEMIEDGKTGYLIPEADIDMAAARIIQILKDEPLANSIKEEGRKSIREIFDIQIFADSINDLYKDILR